MEQMPTTHFGATLLANKLVDDYLFIAKEGVCLEIESMIEIWIKHNISDLPEEFFDIVTKEFMRIYQEKRKC